MTNLAPHLTVTEAVRTFEQAEADIRQALATLEDAERRLSATFGEGERSIYLDRHRLRYDDPKELLCDVRRQVWDGLADRLGVRQMMSVARRERFDREIREADPPEITVESVREIAEGYREALPEMLAEAVEEVFDWLRPPGSEYETNTEYEIGKRAILNWACEKWIHTYHLHERTEARMVALENVLSALDGKGQVNKSYRSQVSLALQQEPSGRVETKYLKVRCFKKGTVHLEFKRMDLVAKLNQLAGGKRLRGRRG